MNHLLRTEDFTELEAALRTADGHLEQNAPEEAFGELRRAQVRGGNTASGWPGGLCKHKKHRFPAAVQRKRCFANYGLLCVLPVAHELFQFIEKALHVGKLPVDRGKADIGHLVDLFSKFLLVSSPMRTLGISRS